MINCIMVEVKINCLEVEQGFEVLFFRQRKTLRYWFLAQPWRNSLLKSF
jgi:hypothetical protein